MSRSRVVLLALALLAAFGGACLGARFLARPDAAQTTDRPDSGAGLRVQQRLAELLMRQGGASHRRDPLVVTTSELNTFLARHLESRRLGLRPLVVRAEDGWLEVAGRTSVRGVLARSAMGGFVELLPATLGDLDVWVSARGRLEVRDGEGEFAVEEARVGRQRVPRGWLWPLLGIEPRRALRWPLPRVVERIEPQRGRLLIHTRPGSD